MVKFVVDSTFCLTREYAEAHDIRIVSLTLTLGDKEYVEGYSDEWGEFYRDYANGKNAAKTSQPSPKAFMNAVDEALGGSDDSEVIIMTIAERLSGTIGSAKIAAMQYPEKKVAAIDSAQSGTSSLAFLRQMINARDEGMSFSELLAYAEDLKSRVALQFIPASLTELARGGRVNKALSLIGNILKIKPVFEFANNSIQVYAKTLGMNKAITAAIGRLPKKTDELFLTYIGDDKHIPQLKERMLGEFGLSDIDVVPMCPVAGAHVGIGTVGIVSVASK